MIQGLSCTKRWDASHSGQKVSNIVLVVITNREVCDSKWMFKKKEFPLLFLVAHSFPYTLVILEQIMSVVKYLCLFWLQMDAIVFMVQWPSIMTTNLKVLGLIPHWRIWCFHCPIAVNMMFLMDNTFFHLIIMLKTIQLK